MQGSGSDVSANLLAALDSNEDSPQYTFFQPDQGTFSQLSLEPLTNEQLTRILATHGAVGAFEVSAATGDTSATTFSAAQLQLRFANPDAVNVGIRQTDSEHVDVVESNIATCGGPLHVLAGVLIPFLVQRSETYSDAVEEATPGALPNSTFGESASRSTRRGNGGCVPTVVAAENAGGGGLVAAVELAAVCKLRLVSLCCIDTRLAHGSVRAPEARPLRVGRMHASHR